MRLDFGGGTGGASPGRGCGAGAGATGEPGAPGAPGELEVSGEPVATTSARNRSSTGAAAAAAGAAVGAAVLGPGTGPDQILAPQTSGLETGLETESLDGCQIH